MRLKITFEGSLTQISTGRDVQLTLSLFETGALRSAIFAEVARKSPTPNKKPLKTKTSREIDS